MDFGDKEYTNYFVKFGYSEEGSQSFVKNTFNNIFYGEDRFYHEIDGDMAYFEDTGNNDARTEGMSYAMMMCVQMDKRAEFDKLWEFAMTYMYMDSGINAGYFAWSVSVNGEKNAYGPAPDGEEYFAMALFFASHRWGDGEGIYDYSHMAKEILHTCIHKGEDGEGRAMWDPSNHLIRFIPEVDFTDPSYHLPHFYYLFSLWAYEEDREFWNQATLASIEYLEKACNPSTGLSAEYSSFDGRPYLLNKEQFGRHDWYYSDAYRTIANIALNYEWFSKGTVFGGWSSFIADKLQKFFCDTCGELDDNIYLTDGTILPEKALHPIAITAVNAEASIASASVDGRYSKECISKLWNTPMRTGNRRYYDNCLYMFAVLALSGNYRIY